MLKKLVTMGLLSAVGASTAMAAVDLDSSTNKGVAIAKDALLTTGATDGTGDNKGTKYYTVSNTGNELDAEAKAAIGFAVDDQMWVRYDITNAAWTADLTPGQLVLNADTADSVSKGGLEGESFVVYTYTVTGSSLDQTEVVSFQPPAVGVSAAGTSDITMTIYSSLADATNATNAVSTKSGTYLRLKEVTVTTGAAGGETAEVSTNFTAFDTNTSTPDLNAPLGTVKVAVPSSDVPKKPGTTNANAILADAVDLSDATSVLTVTGDFSFGTWYLDDDSNDCSSGSGGGTKLTVATDKTSATVAATTLNGGDDELCVEVDGKITIPKTDAYTYSLKLKAVANAASPYATQTGTLGQIKHNGTTVQVPYLTTFSKYNQRLHIVNRGSTDADYSMTFTPEAGTTATAGTAATGTVKAGESAVIKATDAVTLSGNTRTAATLTVVAPSVNIDVLSNQVNPETGSTDSVKLL